MSRKKRVWFPGAIYHVVSRGNRRAILFQDHDDYVKFLECISRAKASYGFKIHSLCLMPNHFHMVIETVDVELWKIMQKILHPYSMDYNRKYKYTGHVFEGRYRDSLIDNDSYFLEVSRYIHLNPVKAKMVKGPLNYEYSSYRLFMRCGRSELQKETAIDKLFEDLVDKSRVLAYFHSNGQEQYRMFVEGETSHAEQEMKIQKEMREDDMWLPF